MPSRRELHRYHTFALVASAVLSPIPCLVAPDRNYTWSLAVFAIPTALILFWFHLTPQDELGPVRKAFYLTLCLLVPMGFLLNLLFANSFFIYPNHQAVLGITVPGADLFGVNPGGRIPIEEIAFYLLGFVAMLMIYIWGDTFFVAKDHVEFAERYKAAGPVVQYAWGPSALAFAVLLIAFLYRRTHFVDGFPGYLLYLMAIPFVVSFTLYRVAWPFVNWPAYAIMQMYVLTVSVLWEVTLAIPGGWWSYAERSMTGIVVARWSNLPLEAPFVWFLAAFATVVTFEAMKVFVYHPGTTLKAKLFTEPNSVNVVDELLLSESSADSNG